jgi:hypothetical protein
VCIELAGDSTLGVDAPLGAAPASRVPTPAAAPNKIPTLKLMAVCTRLRETLFIRELSVTVLAGALSRALKAAVID